MAKRVVYECIGEAPYYRAEVFEFKYFSGTFLPKVQKNVVLLHKLYMEKSDTQPLEVSTKSLQETGVQLSAFNLKDNNGTTVECLFQAAKKFENGGPYTDILEKTSREAKKDDRLRKSGKLVAFVKDGVEYPFEPKTAFYDWLYINTMIQHKDLCAQLDEFRAFTDIEFNPDRSINCQAEAVAIYCGLLRSGMLDKALSSFDQFVSTVWSRK